MSKSMENGVCDQMTTGRGLTRQSRRSSTITCTIHSSYVRDLSIKECAKVMYASSETNRQTDRQTDSFYWPNKYNSFNNKI